MSELFIKNFFKLIMLYFHFIQFKTLSSPYPPSYILAAQHAGSLFPDQGSNSGSLGWERGVLTTGSPGKSLSEFFELLINQHQGEGCGNL